MKTAEMLEGRRLENGWVITTRVALSKITTGGAHCVGYLVQNDDGRKGFLKALDYSRALREKDIPKALQKMVEAYNFERHLLEKCKEHRLTHVVVAVEGGSVIVSPDTLDGVVEYLIFELADGDIRVVLDKLKTVDDAWKLRTIHHVCVGMNQLHGVDIAHQDLKPSNVLVFQKKHSKITDLGHASEKGSTFQGHDVLPIAGDPTYTPPELLFNSIDPDWGRRRLGCDAYLLGSFVCFMFSKVSVTALLLKELGAEHHPNLGESFATVLPYLRSAFGRAMDKIDQDFPTICRDRLSRIVRELCDPDPLVRGHRSVVLASAQYDLGRYTTEIDYLARKAEVQVILGRIL